MACTNINERRAEVARMIAIHGRPTASHLASLAQMFYCSTATIWSDYRTLIGDPIHRRPLRIIKNRIASVNVRAKKLGIRGVILLDDWIDLCNKYGNVCLCCKCSNEILSIDHIIPISKGGSNEIDNIQPLCVQCNLNKAMKTIDYRPKETT